MNQALAKTNERPHQGLTVIEGNNRLARMNMRELKEIASVFIEAGTFNDVKDAAQAMVKIMAGAELGFSPIASMTGVHFFNGKVSIGVNLIASLIKDSGKYEYTITDHTDTSCTVAFFQRIGNEMKSLGAPVTYTIADAQKAQLTNKDNWKKYPKDMLFAACIRQGARRYCADVLRGMTPETEIPQETDLNAGAMDAEIITPAGDIVDTTTGEIVNDVDAATANGLDPAPTKRKADIENIFDICRKLNTAGDSIKWSGKTMTEYVNPMFEVVNGIDQLDDEQIGQLTDDLNERLSILENAAI